ncbi:MAG: hypothetical protein DVB23_002552, partial [Verrucomicrobia bacterium]
SPEMEQIMTLEDLYQLEQEQMSQELEAMRRALSKEKARLEEEQKRREAADLEIVALRKMLKDQEQAN